MKHVRIILYSIFYAFFPAMFILVGLYDITTGWGEDPFRFALGTFILLMGTFLASRVGVSAEDGNL